MVDCPFLLSPCIPLTRKSETSPFNARTVAGHSLGLQLASEIFPHVAGGARRQPFPTFSKRCRRVLRGQTHARMASLDAANYAQALRTFLEHAGMRGWCASGLPAGIRTPALPKYDGVPKGPTWKEVRQLLRHETKAPVPSLRARAILSLCAIYAFRSSEVAGLRLCDIDWRAETLSIKRAK